MERNRLVPNLFNRVVLGVPVVIYIYIYESVTALVDTEKRGNITNRSRVGFVEGLPPEYPSSWPQPVR